MDERTSLRHICYKAIFPVSARDFVVVVTWEVLPSGSIMIASICTPDEIFPVRKSHVRGRILVGGKN